MRTAVSEVNDSLVRSSGVSCKRILLMDDEPTLRILFRIMLEKIGYDPVCVGEGHAAIATYDEARSAGSPFAAVILDLHNKLGLGGIATLTTLQALDPQVKAVVCSADHHTSVIRYYYDHGFCAALLKPCGIQALRDVLQLLV